MADQSDNLTRLPLQLIRIPDGATEVILTQLDWRVPRETATLYAVIRRRSDGSTGRGLILLGKRHRGDHIDLYVHEVLGVRIVDPVSLRCLNRLAIAEGATHIALRTTLQPLKAALSRFFGPMIVDQQADLIFKVVDDGR